MVNNRVGSDRSGQAQGSAGARELEAPPPGSGSGAPPQKIFEFFLHKNGVFWCTLEHGFKLSHVPARSCADN